MTVLVKHQKPVSQNDKQRIEQKLSHLPNHPETLLYSRCLYYNAVPRDDEGIRIKN